MIATAANEPPNESEPVSPIKIFAGGALYQRKPKQDQQLNHKKSIIPLHLECIEFVNIQKKLYFPQHKK